MWRRRYLQTDGSGSCFGRLYLSLSRFSDRDELERSSCGDETFSNDRIPVGLASKGETKRVT